MAGIHSEDIYDALLDEEAFARLPALLAEAANAKSAILHWRHRGGPFETLPHCNFAPDAMACFAATRAEHDPWTKAVQSPRRLNTIFLLEEDVPQRQFADSAVHNEARANDALDTLGLAICTVDRREHLLSANAAAEAVLARGDGLILRRGKLTARAPGCAAALAKSIAEAAAPTAPSAGSAAIARESGKPSYLVSVAPLAGRAGSRAVMLVFRDRDAEDVSLHARLRALFGLSKAEAEIAMALGAGLSATEIGEERRTSANTLGAQIKSIMARLDCHHQAEIAGLVAALPRLRSR